MNLTQSLEIESKTVLTSATVASLARAADLEDDQDEWSLQPEDSETEEEQPRSYLLESSGEDQRPSSPAESLHRAIKKLSIEVDLGDRTDSFITDSYIEESYPISDMCNESLLSRKTSAKLINGSNVDMFIESGYDKDPYNKKTTPKGIPHESSVNIIESSSEEEMKTMKVVLSSRSKINLFRLTTRSEVCKSSDITRGGAKLVGRMNEVQELAHNLASLSTADLGNHRCMERKCYNTSTKLNDPNLLSKGNQKVEKINLVEHSGREHNPAHNDKYKQCNKIPSVYRAYYKRKLKIASGIKLDEPPKRWDITIPQSSSKEKSDYDEDTTMEKPVLRRSSRLRKKKEANIVTVRSSGSKKKGDDNWTYIAKKSKSMTLVTTIETKQTELTNDWVSPGLINFLARRRRYKEEGKHYQIVAQLVSAVRSVRRNKRANIASLLQPIKLALQELNICKSISDFYLFFTKFTPFDFQRVLLRKGGSSNINTHYFRTQDNHGSEIKRRQPRRRRRNVNKP